jgi:hypothetical protein
MNRRVLDRKAIGYKRNIYDLIPEEKIEEKNDILNIKIEEENRDIINDNKEVTETEQDFRNDKRPAKRRRGDSADTHM